MTEEEKEAWIEAVDSVLDDVEDDSPEITEAVIVMLARYGYRLDDNEIVLDHVNQATPSVRTQDGGMLNTLADQTTSQVVESISLSRDTPPRAPFELLTLDITHRSTRRSITAQVIPPSSMG